MTDYTETLEQPAPITSVSWTTFRPKRQELFFHRCVILADVFVLVASFALAYWVRTKFPPLPYYGTLLPFDGYVWLLWVIVPTWVYLTRRFGLVRSDGYTSLKQLLLRILKMHALASLVLFSTMYMTRAVEVSRTFLQCFVVVSFAMLVAEKLWIRFALTHLLGRQKSHNRRVLVVGTTGIAARFDRLLKRHPHWGAQVAGFVSTGQSPEETFAGKPVYGETADLPTLVGSMVIDEVTLAAPLATAEELAHIARICLERGIAFRTLVAMPDTAAGRSHAEDLGNGLYIVSVERTPGEPLPLVIKRAMDVVGSIIGLMAFAVVYLLFARRIRRESGGSAIFSQVRIGQNGRPFTCLKFRTMVADAEDRQSELASDNEMRGFVFKMRNDPRVTKIGRFLRRTYLDELPQFWNVLRGDMSLIGTRPPVPEEVARYAPSHWSRLNMRPGISGLWQVAGNGTVRDFEDIVRLDREYIDNWSLWLDCKLIVRSCISVLRGAGY